MKTYKVEELTLSEARTLSGVSFHFTDKHTAVSENGLITLLTSSKEGFEHVIKSDSFFIYREEESEEPDTNELVWVCGLINQEQDVLMIKTGREGVSSVDRILVSYLTRLLNNEKQFYRFVIAEDTWEVAYCPNITSTQFVLRKINITSNYMIRYSDKCEINKYHCKTGIWPVVQQFRDHLDNYYVRTFKNSLV